MCLGATKANVAEGEFAGVELTFMGLNNQNLHNFLFRGFLKPWEAYTGAKINWIDLAQADYNARLQQSIATGTVDFDIIEMGAPFEGDTAGKGLLDEMPDWVKTQIDMDDYVDYLKAPVGTWDGKTYRISIDGDCHTFAYRNDYFGDEAIAAATGVTTPPTTWDEVNDGQRQGEGPDRPAHRPAGLRLPRPAEGLGRLRLLLPRGPRHRLRQAPGRSGLAVRSRHDEAAGQQPGLGAGDPGRDRPGRGRRLSAGPDQRRSRTPPAFPQFLAGTGVERSPGGATSARTPAPPTPRWSATSSASRSTPAPRRSTTPRPAPGKSRRSRTSRRTWPISAGASTSRAASPATRRSARRPGRAAAHLGGKDLVALDGGLSVGLPALPQLATSTTTSGRRRATTAPSSRTTSARTPTATTTRTPPSSRASPASSSTTRSPRTNW